MLFIRRQRDHNPSINILIAVRHPVGGIRTFLRYVYRQFDPLKYKITIVAPNHPQMKVLMDDLHKHRVIFIPLTEYPSAGEVFKTIFKTIRKNNFDLIHSQGLTAGVLTALPAKIYGIAHMMTAHDVFLENQFKGSAGFLKKIISMTVLPLIDRIHCVSKDVLDNYMEFIPRMRFFKHKLCAIPNGIEIGRFLSAKPVDLRKQFGLTEDTFLIGFLGRFMSQKGFIYLMEAMLKLKDKQDNLPKKPVLLTFGEGGFIREEKIQAKKMGIADYICFNPFVPNIASVLKGLDVVVMPSLWEACGLIAMETMVAGTPFIGTNCIGLREVLKDTPAIVVPMRSSDAICDAIIKEMTCPSTEDFYKFIPPAAKRFDVSKSAKEIENLIQCLSAKSK